MGMGIETQVYGFHSSVFSHSLIPRKSHSPNFVDVHHLHFLSSPPPNSKHSRPRTSLRLRIVQAAEQNP
ncbi:hypothetical protein PanWU01x14_248920, partial [Parasponia andersonii]